MQVCRRLVRAALIGLTATLLLVGCASTGFNAAAKVDQLRQGMTPEQVRAQFGSPSAVRQGAAAQVWRYSLHASWKGWVPYYLVFAGEPATLREWWADQAEFERDQAALNRSFAPLVEALQRSSSSSRGASPAGSGASGGAAGSGAQSEECKSARYREDRMCYCYGVCSVF